MKEKVIPPAASDFDVIIDDDRWADALSGAEAFAGKCRIAAAGVEPRLLSGAALLLADDAALQDLNRRFRGFDKPTNVLSFPAGGASVGFLGDIAIAFETCAREAEAQGIAFRDHAAHLIVHGLLHLAGFDHEEEREAERMESLETAILAQLGIQDPYERDDDAGRS
ncbi:MAG: rRNA maturation RNase YbeY [Pseudomonadota bacterium]